MTVTERYPEEWEDRERLGLWWDPDEIVDLYDARERRVDDDDADDPGPWDLAG